MSKNQEISAKELQQIRSLDDFDLTMLISEIHDHGWPIARQTLAYFLALIQARQSRPVASFAVPTPRRRLADD